MRIILLLIGILAALAAGLAALVVAGEIAAGAAALLVLAIAIAAAFALSGGARRGALVALLVLLVLSLGFVGWTGSQLANGLTTTSGQSDPSDAVALESANSKLDAMRDAGGFRLELTEVELTAVVQDGLNETNTPVRRVTLDFMGGNASDPGAVSFRADFKNGTLSANGLVSYRLEAGNIRPEIREITIGTVAVPRAARGALEDVVTRVADLNTTLAENRVTVQSMEMTDDRLILIGTQGDGKVITSEAVLSGFRSRASSLGSAGEAPPERIGPGTVNATTHSGAPVYVALGDSLAANVGVAEPRDGYVSRFHKAIEERDGKQYGLRNFGISGETSATMLRGQLDDAINFMRSSDVAYVTVDVGANDILPHLGSDDCAETAEAPGCRARIDASLAAYDANLDTVMRRVREAAPRAQVIFLQTYNPFSFGFQGIRFEDDSNRVVEQLNAVAGEVAKRHGAMLADGFTPLKGRSGATTHMADATPDIHPVAIGYDALAAALLEAK